MHLYVILPLLSDHAYGIACDLKLDSTLQNRASNSMTTSSVASSDFGGAVDVSTFELGSVRSIVDTVPRAMVLASTILTSNIHLQMTSQNKQWTEQQMETTEEKTCTATTTCVERLTGNNVHACLQHCACIHERAYTCVGVL